MTFYTDLSMGKVLPLDEIQTRYKFSKALRYLEVICAILFLYSSTSLFDLSPVSLLLTGSKEIEEKEFLDGLDRCHEFRANVHRVANESRENPRWYGVEHQPETTLLRNVTLFDGDSVLEYAVDILLERGIVKSVSRTSDNTPQLSESNIWDLEGKFATPGLVDMHSHHLLIAFPGLPSIRDVNEMPLLGPLTPYVQSIDGIKPYDPATTIIASGGVTSSLILPGSGNIIGGEGYLVKNVLSSGKDGEFVVEELLFDHGLASTDRQRYMKMACGENPKGIYGHTRMGNVWLLREHFTKARELKKKQDEWCHQATIINQRRFGVQKHVQKFLKDNGNVPESLQLESTIALLRGQVNLNIHCYEPQDFERMLSVCHEFGVHPQAFHHALEAWQVPELLKRKEPNITIATFADNALFKHEAYDANLRAGKILVDHGIPVAFKSDHTGEASNAKYLIYQAAISHSFGLSEEKALQSVTSVPAKSLQQNHRIGYVRPGHDADIVVWDSHPLSVGATALQVYVDGKPTLDSIKVSQSLERAIPLAESRLPPSMRPVLNETLADEIQRKVVSTNKRLVFTGIDKVLLDIEMPQDISTKKLTMIVEDDHILCLNTAEVCLLNIQADQVVALENGYITPGLIAVSQTLGLIDINSEESTGDGRLNANIDDIASRNIGYAKYGVHFEGKGFERARVGGITKAITTPLSHGGLLQGVSVGIRTAPGKTALNGGIFQDDIALHFVIGQASKGKSSTPTISSAIAQLRRILSEPGDGVYAQAANGTLPTVIYATNQYDILQIIWMKKDFPNVNFVIYGGHGAALVAKELAVAQIPVILTGNRGAPDLWEKKDALSGPPLTKSPSQILAEEGVLFALALQGDSRIHSLASEAGWAAKYIGLDEKAAIKLVSTNFEKILNLKLLKGEKSSFTGYYDGDIVIWEGNPLTGEGSVVFSLHPQ